MPQKVTNTTVKTTPSTGGNYVTVGDVTRNNQGLTPHQVVARLPKKCTESQRDSAIQANFHRGTITYNDSIDTLKCFGLKLQNKKISDMKLMDESFFAGSKYFHPELGVCHDGQPGDPIPYTISRDNTIASLLLCCFLIAIVSIANSRSFIMRQARSFFYTPRRTDDMTETGNEVRFQLFLGLQTCLLLAIVFYLSLHYLQGNPMTLDSQLEAIGVFCAINMVYLLLKGACYQLVNWTFFSSKKNKQWMRTWLFLMSTEGIVLFPVVLVQIYFGLPLAVTAIYSLIVVALFKLLSFYKCYTIFFRRNGIFVQSFLYFCALELMPLGVLWGVLNEVEHCLMINF